MESVWSRKPPEGTVASWRRADLLLLIGISVVYRSVALARIMFAADEANVTQRQVDLIHAFLGHGLWSRVIFDIGLMASNGMTPLWAWLQAVTTPLVGLGPYSTRVLPFICSIVAVAVGYQITDKYLGRGVALMTGLGLAISDMSIYTAVNSSLVEQFFLLISIVSLWFWMQHPRRGSLWGALFLSGLIFTYLSKGLFIWGLFGLWRLSVFVVALIKEQQRKNQLISGFIRECGLFLLALVPTLIWLGLAQLRVQALAKSGMFIGGDLGIVWSIPEHIQRATFKFLEFRPTYVAVPKQMAMVYTLFAAYPSGCLLAPWALLGFITSLEKIRAESDPYRYAFYLVVPMMGMIPFLFFFTKGFDAGHWNVLYLFPLALAAGMGMKRSWEWAWRFTKGHMVRGLWVAVLPFAYIIWILRISHWHSFSVEWIGFLLALTALTIWILGCWLRANRLTRSENDRWFSVWRATPYVLYILFLLYSSYIYGPLYWGPTQGTEIGAAAADSFDRYFRETNPESAKYFYLLPPKPLTCQNGLSPIRLYFPDGVERDTSC